MSTIAPIIIAVLVGSVGALAGGVLLLFHQKLKDTVIHVLVPFAAGALLGTAFFELLPEASQHAEEAHEAGMEVNIFIWALGGIILFYLLERGIHWFQYHRRIHKGEHGNATVPLIIIGDSIHNFIDGMAIAITFMVNPSLGILTTLAVVAHELPQEIGDFAVLLHEGLSRKKVFFFNLLSALLAVVGAIIALIIGESVESIFPYALSITAGLFIYIALTNLLPTIHHEEKKGYAFMETFFLLLGILLIYLAATFVQHGH